MTPAQKIQFLQWKAQRLAGGGAAKSFGHVVDGEGNPLEVYHGTSDNIDKFQLGHPNRKDVGWLGHGIYFTNNSDMAMANAKMKAKRVGGTPKVMSVNLNLQNPYYATLEDKARLQKADSSEASQAFSQALKDKGHDGVIWKQNDYHEYVAFHPDQIKILPQDDVVRKDKGGVVSPEDRQQNLSKFMEGAHPAVLNEDGTPKRFYHATYAKEPIEAFDRLWSTKVRRPSMDTVGTWFSDNPSEEGGAGMYGSGQGASIYPMHLSAKKLRTYKYFEDFLADMHSAEGRNLRDQNPKGIGSTEGLREKLKAQGYDGLYFPKNDTFKWGQQIEQIEAAIKQMKSSFSVESKRRWDEGDEMSLSEQKAHQKKIDALVKQRMDIEKKKGPYGGSTEFGRQNVVVVFEPTQIKSPWNRGTYDTNEEDTHKASGGIVHKDKGGDVEGKTPISDWNWRPMSDVQEQLGGLEEIPSHVLNFGKFMDETANKAGAKGLSARDLIKAFTITRSSIQRGAVDADKVRAAGLDLDPSISGKVRPEGAFGEWLHTDMGQRYLKNAERGSVDPVSISNAVQVMAPFGRHTTDIPDALTWAAKNIPGKEKGVSLLVVAAQQGTSDPSQWRDFIKDIRGIGPSKAGFVASLLGRGDQPTLDARQLILHTGQPSKAAAPYLKRKGGADEAVERLAERQRQMNLSIPSNLSPYYQHLAHHTVWDAVGGDQTTHQDVINAMQNAAQGGRIESNPVIDHPFVNVMQAMGLPVFGKKPKPIAKKATGGPVSLDAMRLALLNVPKMADGGDFESDSLLPQGRAQRRMASNMMAGPKPLTITKETGGQWLEGSFGNVEPTIGQYRQSGDSTPEKQAVNNWVNTTLTKYMKRDFGTENDPVRLLHEQGITHYSNPDELESRGLRDHLSWMTGIRKARGMPEAAISKSNLAKGWEAVSDPLIRSKTARGLINNHQYAVEMLSENPWLKKVDPQTKVFSFDTGLTDNTEFKHLTDELHNSLLENTNLPKSLQLRPESLNRMSVAQAVSHVHKINNWRKENRGDASREKAMSSAVHLHKDYPDSNYAWYEIKHPEMTADEKAELRDSRLESMEDASESLQAKYKTLEDALQYEGDVMGHCVGGYADEVAGGESRIFSLRHKKTGEPHVTIETHPKPISALEALPSSEKIPMQNAIRQWRQKNPQVESLTDNHVREALKEAKIDLPEDIEQIKGKGNDKPVGKYIPFVQDFVKSGNWSNVSDLKNTDLRDLEKTPVLRQWLKGKNIPHSRFVSEDEYNNHEGDFLLDRLNEKAQGGIVRKADGGTIKGNTMPTLAQMRMALMKPNDISSIGVSEAPSMSPKAYFSPDKNSPYGQIPVGGVDLSMSQQGQQLMAQPPQQPQMQPQNGMQPQQPPQPQGGPQPPQGALPEPSPQGPPQGPQGPQSNMLEMTPQGQMMGAMTPVRKASGGGISGQGNMMLNIPLNVGSGVSGSVTGPQGPQSATGSTPSPFGQLNSLAPSMGQKLAPANNLTPNPSAPMDQARTLPMFSNMMVPLGAPKPNKVEQNEAPAPKDSSSMYDPRDSFIGTKFAGSGGPGLFNPESYISQEDYDQRRSEIEKTGTWQQKKEFDIGQAAGAYRGAQTKSFFSPDQQYISGESDYQRYLKDPKNYVPSWVQKAASGGSIQYPTINPAVLKNQDDGANLQPVNWMSGGDVEGMNEGGSPEPSDNVSMLTEMLAKKYRPEVTTASEALGQHEGKNLKVTQSDRTKVGGGFLGGPGFSSLQHVDPDYEGMAWGVNSPGAASKIINATKEHPKGNVLWSTMIGSPEQHSSNQMVFNLMLREFKKGIKAGKLKPETRSAINQKLVSAVNTDGKPIFGNKTDISTSNFFDSLNTFDKRRVMADLMAGVAVGGKKGQIFNYDKILQDTTEPELVGAPTHAIGPRLFTVTGERSERPDLHPAFPHIIHGEDLGQMYHPVPNEVMLPEFHEKIQNTKGRKVGYMDLTRNTPSQFLSEEFLSGLQKKGYKKGGEVSMDAMQLALINRKKGK